jgi:CarboxypepD_reg-like domain
MLEVLMSCSRRTLPASLRFGLQPYLGLLPPLVKGRIGCVDEHVRRVLRILGGVRMGQFLLILHLLTLLFLGVSLPCEAQQTLQGHLEKTAEPILDKLQGQVLDATTGQPVAGATVTLPDQGFSMKTDTNGEYQIPRALGKAALIMSVEKEGYMPFSMGISENTPPKFYIRLNKQAQILVLDTQLRHLGDGSFSSSSSGALEFSKPPDGAALRIPFTLGGLTPSVSPYLEIGSIVGLDTAMAHLLSGNRIGVAATPLLLKLNGTLIAQIQVNGDNQKINVPRDLLTQNGTNTLEIETGYHYPEPGRIDYDDMELMHIVLHL